MPAERKPFLLRLDPQLLAALQRWARDDLRSVNAQLEFLLRGLLAKAGRLPERAGDADRGASGGGATDDRSPPPPAH